MEERNRRKTREGMVVSTKMEKTVVVLTERMVKHPLYGKVIRRRKRLMVHDEDGSCNVGDFVQIMETRPLSKNKRWRYVSTIRAAK